MNMNEGLEFVEAALRRAIASDVERLSVASEDVLSTSRSRLRPRVAILSFGAAGGQNLSRVVHWAAAVELLHLASLIHADLSDTDEIGRGRLPLSARWGPSLALLVGDHFFARLVHLIAALDFAVVSLFSDAWVSVVEGEALYTLCANDVGMTQQYYLSIVSKRTAELISTCAQVAGMLAGASDGQVSALRNYGLDLGIALQIKNDALEIISMDEQDGSFVTADRGQANPSLATIHAIRVSPHGREVVLSKDAESVRRLVRETGGADYAMRIARQYSDRARADLTGLADSEEKSELLELAEAIVASP